MRDDEFIWILFSSFFVSTIIFYFTDSLWGWGVVNMMAFLYYLILKKFYLYILYWSLPTIMITIFIKSIFLISLISMLVMMLIFQRGVRGWDS